MEKLSRELRAEKSAVSKMVRASLNAGYSISVNDGEEYPVKRSRKYFEIMRSLMACDVEWLIIRKNGEKIGVIMLVWGNSAEEVAADYSVNPIIEAIVEHRPFVN